MKKIKKNKVYKTKQNKEPNLGIETGWRRTQTLDGDRDSDRSMISDDPSIPLESKGAPFLKQ